MAIDVSRTWIVCCSALNLSGYFKSLIQFVWVIRHARMLLINMLLLCRVFMKNIINTELGRILSCRRHRIHGA